jgi:hypothetical protein
MGFYDKYDHFVSGKINDTNAWDVIKEIESRFHVDNLKLDDGTRIWNLLRIFIYTFNYEMIGVRKHRLLSLLKLVPMRVHVKKEYFLRDVIGYIHMKTKVDEDVLRKAVYDYIRVFVILKKYYHFKYKIKNPGEVVIGCGYGRRPMAQAQACRELGIRCIEDEHGVIDNYFPAYRRDTPTMNHDCIPEYIRVYDDVFASVVKEGNLFDKDKVITARPPASKKYVLFTSQWILADEIHAFISRVAELLNENYIILFMPHSLDTNKYSDLSENIMVVDKDKDFFELLRSVDVHATVFSGRGYYSFTHGVPTVFVDILNLMDGFPVTPEDFIKELEEIK